MSRFRRAWTSLNFYNEYLFGFETLVFATLGILSIHKQLVTPKRKENLKSHRMATLMSIMDQIDPPWQTANIFVLFNAFETLCFPQCITDMSQVYFPSVNVRKSCKYIHLAVRSG